MIISFAISTNSFSYLRSRGGRMGKSNTPLNPLLIDGTLRDEKIRKTDTPLDPLLIEGTLREEKIGKTDTPLDPVMIERN